MLRVKTSDIPNIGHTPARALAALRRAPEARLEDAEETRQLEQEKRTSPTARRENWYESRARYDTVYAGPYPDAPDSREHASLLLLASLSVPDEYYYTRPLYPSAAYIEQLKAAAPVIEVSPDSRADKLLNYTARSSALDFRVLVVDGIVVLKPLEDDEHGILMGRRPTGFPEEKNMVEPETPVSDASGGEERLSLSEIALSGGPAHRDAKPDARRAARFLAKRMQQALDNEYMLKPYQEDEASGSSRYRITTPEITARKDTALAASPGKDMRGITVKDARFDGSSLAGVSMRGSVLALVSFSGCDMRAADLQAVEMDGAEFMNCDLDGATMTASTYLKNQIYIEGCSLRRASLKGVKFGDTTTISDCDLQGADLRNTIWPGDNPNAPGCFSNLVLKDANLAGADLRDSHLSGCDMRGVRNLGEANLEGCNLKTSTLDRETKVLAALKGALL